MRHVCSTRCPYVAHNEYLLKIRLQIIAQIYWVKKTNWHLEITSLYPNYCSIVTGIVIYQTKLTVPLWLTLLDQRNRFIRNIVVDSIGINGFLLYSIVTLGPFSQSFPVTFIQLTQVQQPDVNMTRVPGGKCWTNRLSPSRVNGQRENSPMWCVVYVIIYIILIIHTYRCTYNYIKGRNERNAPAVIYTLVRSRLLAWLRYRVIRVYGMCLCFIELPNATKTILRL